MIKTITELSIILLCQAPPSNLHAILFQFPKKPSYHEYSYLFVTEEECVQG